MLPAPHGEVATTPIEDYSSGSGSLRIASQNWLINVPQYSSPTALATLVTATLRADGYDVYVNGPTLVIWGKPNDGVYNVTFTITDWWQNTPPPHKPIIVGGNGATGTTRVVDNPLPV